MAPSGSEMTICPRNIRYTQDSIKGEFWDGKTMWKTLEDLLYGRNTVEKLPLIEVVRDDGKWWALTGNRRLYLYRKLEELKVIHTIPVVTVSLDSDEVRRKLGRRKTTDCEGVTIRLRGNQPPGWHITQVIDTWQASQRNNRYASSGGQTNAERSGSQRGRSLDRNRSNRANPSNEFDAPIVIYPPSVRQGRAPQRSASIERPPNRPAIPVPFYDGCGTNPVGSLSGSTRSSTSNARTSVVRDFPRPVAPTPPDRGNAPRTGGWLSSGGVSGGVGQNYMEPHVITSQPRSSTYPIISSDDSCCSCCADSCCSSCCCCFPCCRKSTD